MGLQRVKARKGVQAFAHEMHTKGRNPDEKKPRSSGVTKGSGLDAVKSLIVFFIGCISEWLVDESTLAKRKGTLRAGDLPCAFPFAHD